MVDSKYLVGDTQRRVSRPEDSGMQSQKQNAGREREKKCRKSNRKKCREENAETTVGVNHDREIELVRVRRRIKRNGGVI